MPNYNPDFYSTIIEPSVKAGIKPPPAPANVLALRAAVSLFLEDLDKKADQISAVTRTTYQVPGHGGVDIDVIRLATPEQLTQKNQPAILYFHGGGMVLASAAITAADNAQTVFETGVQIFSVDYRLAPESTHETILGDCYAALTYLHTHADDLGIDPARICVSGNSAGGGLSAGVALMARDQGLTPPIAKLVLIYPMLDDRTVHRHPPKGTPPYPGATANDDDWPVRPFLQTGWSCENNALAWASYYGAGQPQMQGPAEAAVALAALPESAFSIYASPARAPSLAGLPSTYMDVGSLDLFLEEDTIWATQLARADVDLDFHIVSGLPHAYDLFDSKPTRDIRKLRNIAYKSF